MRKIMKNEGIQLPADKSQSFFMHKAKLSKVETQVLKKSSSKLQYFLTKQVQDFICRVQKKQLDFENLTLLVLSCQSAVALFGWEGLQVGCCLSKALWVTEAPFPLPPQNLQCSHPSTRGQSSPHYISLMGKRFSSLGVRFLKKWEKFVLSLQGCWELQSK